MNSCRPGNEYFEISMQRPRGGKKGQLVITIKTDGILAAMAIGINGRFGDI